MLVAAANARDLWPRRVPQRGFYDGASSDVHLAQMQEAVAAGLDGFGVYHYWFYSRHELSAFEQTLSGPHQEAVPFPWFVVWATESWSRRWIGDATQILELSSSPTEAEVRIHCEYLATLFACEKYFRLNNRPLFVIYNLGHFLEPGRIVDLYRRNFKDLGFEPLIGHFVKNPMDIAFAKLVDFNYLFEPRLYFGTKRAARGVGAKRSVDVVRRILGDDFVSKLMVLVDRIQQKGTTYSSDDFYRYMKSDFRRSFVDSIEGDVQNVISPGWNNVPRYGERFTCLSPIPPDQFSELVSLAPGNRLPVLINAWNEWSEGAAIEPCAYYGDRYLKAIQQN